ncbi:MAG: CDP-alcohol phosphatidyltransferase family protein [Sedimentibacter sp.]|uniref:CDP-alcohol phosphatidyltransferase family protein n=1 Tax=Sedimentibacter sp. TaxID=1960295 RepID=UPI0031588AFC
MKSVANIISVARMVLVLVLIFINPLSTIFFTIYFICGISDMVDGYVARKTNTTSKLGEKLDSVADLIMIFVLAIKLYPIISPTVQIYYFIIIIGAIRTASIMAVFVKYKTFGILHTYGNKITGLMLFVFPFMLAVIKSDVSIYMLCMAAGISSLEELVINLLSSEWNANKKSIFIK